MKRFLLFIFSLGLFLLAPTVQHEIYGAESTIIQQNHIMSDESINHAVRDAIASDPGLSPFIAKVNITVDKGVVTLSGVVGSSKAKSDMESKAKAVMGVKKVVNSLEVKKGLSE